MKISKILLLLPIFLVIATSAEAQLPDKVKCFPVSQVRLTESPFKHAQDLDICYLLGLDPDRLLAPYRKEAGVPPKAPNYGNWENSGLDGPYRRSLSIGFVLHVRSNRQSGDKREVGLHVGRIGRLSRGFGGRIPLRRSGREKHVGRNKPRRHTSQPFQT